MSLSKKRIQDQIEIVGEYKIIQIRYSDQIIEDDLAFLGDLAKGMYILKYNHILNKPQNQKDS